MTTKPIHVLTKIPALTRLSTYTVYLSHGCTVIEHMIWARDRIPNFVFKFHQTLLLQVLFPVGIINHSLS